MVMAIFSPFASPASRTYHIAMNKPSNPAQAPTQTRPWSKAATFAVIALCLAVLLLQEDGRMFWPYMIVTYIMAAGVYVYERRKNPSTAPSTFWSYAFSRDIWLHPSAKNDYAIALINLAIGAAVAGSLVIWHDGAFYFVYHSLSLLFPARPDAGAGAIPGTGAIIAYTLVSFCLADLAYYIVHRITHKVPILWELHKVHHSAKVMTPVTLHRAHPLDVWLNVLGRVIGLGVASGVFLYLYPTIEGVMTVGGVNTGLAISYVLGANLRHSHVWLPYGKYLEHVFMSPAQHQIHHSENPAHYDRNFGSALSLWDWMFGSLYIIRGKEPITFGLANKKEEDAHYSTLGSLYLHPLRQIYRRLRRKYLRFVE